MLGFDLSDEYKSFGKEISDEFESFRKEISEKLAEQEQHTDVINECFVSKLVDEYYIVKDAISKKAANDVCPECGKIMRTTIKPSVAIDYIIHDCDCGFHRKEFV